ncbi:MAG: DUF6094 domain-containing protein, partial [Candidatus Promineifilaceae bacterium]
MARLAAAEKGGYYPLPAAVTPLIFSYVAASHGGRILDPCAGAGLALAALAAGLKLEAYGVELHQERALEAAECLQALAGRKDLPFQDHLPRRLIQGDYRT